MQIDERSDGAEETLLNAIHLQMEIAKAVGRSANTRIAARLRDQRRREQDPRYREKQERKEARAQWKEDRKKLKGVGRNSWWKDATPVRIQDAALAVDRHRDDKWRAKIAGWNLNRQYKKRFGTRIDELVENTGPNAPNKWTELERMGAEVASIVPRNAQEERGLQALYDKLERMEQDNQYLREQLGLSRPQEQSGQENLRPQQGQDDRRPQQDQEGEQVLGDQRDQRSDQAQQGPQDQGQQQQDQQPPQPQPVQRGQEGADERQGGPDQTSAQNLLGRGNPQAPPVRNEQPQGQDHAARRHLAARQSLRGPGQGRGD